MKNWKQNKGFTLIEVLIATSVFTLAAVLASQILVDIVKTEKKTSIENAIYEDARILMEQLTIAIQQNAIDYDEYYNQYVIQVDDLDEDRYYGTNFGVYESRFYNPGLDETSATPGTNPADLGVYCSNPPGNTETCDAIASLTEDYTMGQNPWNGGEVGSGVDQDAANAFCDEDAGNCDDTEDPYATEELYLINANATEKMVLARRETAGQGYLGLLAMQGFDTDFNGITDIFRCGEDHSAECEDDRSILMNEFGVPFDPDEFPDLTVSIANAVPTNNLEIDNLAATPFLPVSPLRVDLTDLQFYISPIEDPYRGWNEDTSIQHPWVKIVFTIDLADEVEAEYPGDFEPITLQTTVAAGVVGGIPSYPPVKHLYDPTDPSTLWINEVLSGLNANES